MEYPQMRSECCLDFCFVRSHQGNFAEDIDHQLFRLFEDSLYWYLEYKVDNGLDIVVAEVRGLGNWQTENELLDYLDEKGNSLFWEWLKGFRFQVFSMKSEGCCGGCQ
jgi:hypothetical protein